MIATILQTASVMIAAISVVVGVTAWRRATVGQRRLDLAEQVIEQFYEAKDALSAIRSPFGYTGEGSTRKRGEHETEEERKLLDNAYVAIERYEKRSEVFSKLQALRHRSKLYFGEELAKQFLELNSIVNEILLASNRLSRHWRDQGRRRMSPEQFQKHLDSMHAAEAVFWEGAEDPDPLQPRIQAMISRVEEICGTAIDMRRGLRAVFTRWGDAIDRYVTG